jgi:uncharacterized PurR-regulated membrane protein YhhQ (DUF165 family)
MFGLVMTLGNTIYGTIYMTTDLINEKYGAKEAKKAVWFGFLPRIALGSIAAYLVSQTLDVRSISQEALKIKGRLQGGYTGDNTR